ncbi:alkaline phosphatase D family protein [Bradyrhizobium japonicum]|uniref:alkaline phosphatase D family protein n=1 Tax=Bradyrhizobium japonicum TaxID=375 RepID=UPI0003F82FD2|nr:alkaline phosphatase D family protein [Bradyrhizobium japonicum]WLB86875.1 alkaline phosphatase D family protein [Bradyrhizobium japonicum USDA 135]
MPSRPSVTRIVLGPIVGHTDHQSSRVWIQVADDPALYRLRVYGVGLFPFISTELGGPLEFRTAIAEARGLRSDFVYRYAVVRQGRTIANGKGMFRTMPDPGSLAHLTFCAISCNIAEEDGQWAALGKYIADARPQFLLMMGDQVYLDEGAVNLFDKERRRQPREKRRAAIAEKYRENWSRPVVRDVLANIPVYMVWDDHDTRDGWGSSPADSPTMVTQHPRGQPIFELCRRYYEDCRDAYWHFQGCRNPRPSNVSLDPALPNYVDAPPAPGARRAMPYAFRCGRLVVIVLDSGGERDVFRASLPILGADQWQFIDRVFANLAPDVEALAVMTATPLASIDPDGPTMKLMGNRTDDIEAFRRGSEAGTLDLSSNTDPDQLALAIVNAHVSPTVSAFTGSELNLGNFKLSGIDEARDQWSHKFSRPEQAALLRAAGRARLANRAPDAPRGLIFLAGDIHVGARFTIRCEEPAYEALSLVASGINTVFNKPPTIDVLLSRDFDVAPGIRSTLKEVVVEPNFGVIEVVPTGNGAKINCAVAHEGVSAAFGLDISNLL